MKYKGIAKVRAIGILMTVLLITVLSNTVQAGTNVELDPVFGVPIPPVTTPFDITGSMVFSSILLLIGIIALILSIRESIKTSSLLPTTLALSSVMLIAAELLADVMGGVWHPVSPDYNLLTILGRRTNMIVLSWLGMGLFFFIGFKLLEKGLSTRGVWLFFIIGALANVVIEETTLNIFTVYVYYGNQPTILLWKFPWWQSVCNFGGATMIVALAYRFKEQLRGWKALLMFFITPMTGCGFYAFVGMPAFIVVNGNYSWLITQAGGILTILMAFAAIALGINLVLQRDPFNLSFKPELAKL